MKHKKYLFEDLIGDECFKQWVKSPDKNSDFFWESYLESYPEESTNIDKARYFIQTIDFPLKHYTAPTTAEIENSYANITDSTNSKAISFKESNQNKVNWYFKVAASISILLFFSLIWYWATDRSQVVEIAEIPQEMIEKYAPPGQKLTVALPDGSMVKLNSGSSIIYPKEFNSSDRSVILEGEAFFEVTKNPQKPFVVKSSGLLTTVLGTSFVVKAYLEENQIQVAVLTGKVLVEKENKSNMKGVEDKIFLLPNESVAYSTENNELKKGKFNYNKSFSWKDNVLYFENADLTEIMSSLSKWYGKEIEVNKKEIYEKDFSGRYEDQSLEMVLEGLSFTFGFRYTITDSKIIIY